MSILGNIAHRLKTDIGENLRAQIDIGYSKQLTEARFNEAAQDKADIKESNIRKETRRNKLIDQENRDRVAFQIKTATELFDLGKGTGDYSGLINFLDNSPSLTPAAREYAEGLANVRNGTKSIEGIRVDEQKRANIAKEATADLRNKILESKLDLETEKFAFDELAKRVESINTEMDRIRSNDSVFGIVKYINTSPALTEKQRAKWLPLVQGPIDKDTAFKIFDAIQKENLEELKTLRKQMNSNNKSGDDGLAPAPATSSDIKQVEVFIDDMKEKLPGFDTLSKGKDGGQEKFITFIANEMKEIGKNTKKGGNDAFMEAFETAKAGMVLRARELGLLENISNALIGRFFEELRIKPSLIATFSPTKAIESKNKSSSRFTIEVVE